MNNEESLNLLNQKPENVKGAIIQKLSKQWPLTLKQIDHSIKREFGMDVTYQAIHKVMSYLEKEKIVEKTTKGFQLHPGWIQTITKLSNQISTAYSNNQPLDFEKEIIQLKFNSWIEVGRFGAFTFKEETPNPENKPTITCLIHVWPVNTVSIEEAQRIEKWSKKETFYILSMNNTVLDQTFAGYLEKIHIKNVTGASINIDYDYIVRGNHIAYIYYQKPFAKKVDIFYRNTKGLTEIDYVKLQQLVTEKTTINVTIVKNAELAEQLRNEAMEFFRLKKKNV